MPNSLVCVDASCVVRLVAGTVPERAAIQRHWDGWTAEGRSLVAPRLLLYEVTNALYRYRRLGQRSPLSVRLSLQAALDLPIRFHDEPDLHAEAIAWADRFSLSAAYDAHCLALADKLAAEFWTADRRLANAVPPALPWVHLIDP